MSISFDTEVIGKLIREAWLRGQKGHALPKDLKLQHECHACGRAEWDFQKTINTWDLTLSNDRGSGWHAARTEALRRAPFCGVCGAQEHLEVHHIVPFRVSQDNSQSNLIPLCRRCHRRVDEAFRKIEWMLQDSKTAKLMFWLALKERQLLVVVQIRQILAQYSKLEKQLKNDIDSAWRRGLGS
ncbi:HNH endonuclease signature motif containing protein [Magnetococcus sp. PR-3]|uniref:HNH endonuclease signature motif containing protein n=1 Tax=Magnetococcus sp. PR-3 TaxID=3120355 RepID=UPI002FCE5598